MEAKFLERLTAIFCSLCLLTACGPGGATSATIPQNVPTLLGSLSETNGIPLGPLSSASVNDLLYVSNRGNNSITVYRDDASGNTIPRYVIAGPKTGISKPGQLSQDAAGNLYVLNAPASILVFAPGAHGNVAPMRVLSGPATTMQAVGAMTVDKKTGNLYVVDDDMKTQGSSSSLLRFAVNANGNVAPLARADIGDWAVQVTSDSSGMNLIDAHVPTCCSDAHSGIYTYSKQYENRKPPTLVRSINAMLAAGVADDPTNKTYLVSTIYGIWRLYENTTGNGPFDVPENLSPAAAGVITNDTCSSSLSVGRSRAIYSIHSSANGCPADAVYVYASTANGDAAPLRIIHGTATGLSTPYGIYEGK